MRKKFFSFCGKWLLLPLEFLLGGIEKDVRCLFSFGSEPAGEEWKRAVIEGGSQRVRALLPVSRGRLAWLDGADESRRKGRPMGSRGGWRW